MLLRLGLPTNLACRQLQPQRTMPVSAQPIAEAKCLARMGLLGIIGCRPSVSSSIGPPASCPLPEGAGYATLERDQQGRAVFCRTDGRNQCGSGYECIEAAGQFSETWNGLCCPLTKELVCRTLPAGNDLSGRLPRFWWNGTDCLPFLWTPESVPETRCANTFTTREHCLSFCADDESTMFR